MTDVEPTAQQLWDARYAEKPAMWSGRVNAVVAELIESLEPATALDLGCGEGGDVLWLAERGWHATGVDVSTVAIERAIRAADERGVAVRARFERRDLQVDGVPTGPFELVLASYLHSPGELDRRSILRAAADTVAPGGRLLVVGHAAPPPWADEHAHHHALPSLDDTRAELALDDRWSIEVTEVRGRDVVAPDGTPAELLDVVVLALRR